MAQPDMCRYSDAGFCSDVSAGLALEDASFASSLHSWHSDGATSWGIPEIRTGTSVRARLIQSGYVVDASRLTAQLVKVIEEAMRLVMILDGKCNEAGIWETLCSAGRRIDAMWQANTSQVMSWQDIVEANISLTEAREFFIKEFSFPHPPDADCAALQGSEISCSLQQLLETDSGKLLRVGAHFDSGHSCTNPLNVQLDPCVGCTFVVQFAKELTHLELNVNTLHKLTAGAIEDDDVWEVLGDVLDMLEIMDPRDVERLSLAARRLHAAQESVSAAFCRWSHLHVASAQAAS